MAVLGDVDYTLRWPPELLVREIDALLPDPLRHGWSEQVTWLLEEAFVSEQPQADFGATVKLPADFWLSGSSGAGVPLGASAGTPVGFLQQLITAAPRLPTEAAPRPYFPARRARVIDPAEGPDLTGAQRDWLAVIRDLRQHGYLERIAPAECVDGGSDQVDPEDALDATTVDRLGRREFEQRYWPLDARSWDEDTFYGLVEVVHDLVARPRARSYHSYGRCGWHYSTFAVGPAQILYRWLVNRLLGRHGIPLRLAKSGEDVGRLVHGLADGRQDLAETAVTRAGADRDPIRHAVALFRDRGASVEDKRSACIALAGVLENRRELLKTKLLTKDEGALFEIANRFDVRHRKADQRRDYDEAYLDWLYWWYLGTVELTDRLIERKAHR